MDIVIVDVREPHEFAMDHVEGAINLPPSEIMAGAHKLDGIPKDTKIVLYCVSGSRSNASMHYLRQMGFTNLVNGINKQHVKAQYLN